ncbi:MAG: hypothetical protein ACRDGM_10715 [bacterium]
MTPATRSILAGLLTGWLIEAQASTGIPAYFGWLLLSLYVAIPMLLAVPVIAIARASYRRNRRLWFAGLVALVGAISYGTLLWAATRFTLGATASWPVIFLWLLPSYALWLAMHVVARSSIRAPRKMDHDRPGR